MSSEQQIADAFRKVIQSEAKVEVIRCTGFNPEPFTRYVIRHGDVYYETGNGKNFYLTYGKLRDMPGWEWF